MGKKFIAIVWSNFNIAKVLSIEVYLGEFSSGKQKLLLPLRKGWFKIRK